MGNADEFGARLNPERLEKYYNTRSRVKNMLLDIVVLNNKTADS